LEIGKISKLKSHDHIFMERLLRVIFRRYFNDDVWTALAELSHFFGFRLCGSKTVKWITLNYAIFGLQVLSS
jgi:hypothetical protein